MPKHGASVGRRRKGASTKKKGGGGERSGKPRRIIPGIQQRGGKKKKTVQSRAQSFCFRSRGGKGGSTTADAAPWSLGSDGWKRNRSRKSDLKVSRLARTRAEEKGADFRRSMQGERKMKPVPVKTEKVREALRGPEGNKAREEKEKPKKNRVSIRQGCERKKRWPH